MVPPHLHPPPYSPLHPPEFGVGVYAQRTWAGESISTTVTPQALGGCFDGTDSVATAHASSMHVRDLSSVDGVPSLMEQVKETGTLYCPA
jgi:hypothetical protein